MCTCQSKVAGRPKRKKVAAKKTKKKVVSAPAKTIKINGSVFKHDQCFLTKTGAAAAAKQKRSSGKLARVLKVGKGHCVYSR
jgi:hypothetical protein